MWFLACLFFCEIFAGMYGVDPIQHQLQVCGVLECTKGVRPICVFYTSTTFMPHTQLYLSGDNNKVEFFDHTGSYLKFIREAGENFGLSKKIRDKHCNSRENFFASMHPSNYKVTVKDNNEVVVTTPDKKILVYSYKKLVEDSYFSSNKKYQLRLKEEKLDQDLVLEYVWDEWNLTQLRLKRASDRSLVNEIRIQTEGRTRKIFAYDKLIYEILIHSDGYHIKKNGSFFESFRAPNDYQQGYFQNALGDWYGFESFDDRIKKVYAKDHEGNPFILQEYTRNIYENINIQHHTQGVHEFFVHDGNRILSQYKILSEDYERLQSELKKFFDGVIFNPSKEQFLKLLSKRSSEWIEYQYKENEPLISQIFTFCKYNLVSVEQFFYQGLQISKKLSYNNVPLFWEKEFKFKTSCGPTEELIFRWDQSGHNLMSMVGNKNLVVNYSYDNKKRLSAKEYLLEGAPLRREEFSYDESGCIATFVDKDPNSNICRIEEFTHDARGMLQEKRYKTPDLHLKTERFSYDENANLKEQIIINADGECVDQIEFSYDANQNIISQTSQTGEQVENIYDTCGRVIRQNFKKNGTFTEYSYDDRGLIVATKTPRGTERVFFDRYKRAEQLIDFRGSITKKTFNPFSKVTTVQMPQKGGKIPCFSYFYDEQGNTKKEIDPMGRAVCYKKNNQGKNLSIELGGLKKFFSYNRQGLLTKEIDPNDQEKEYILDGLGRVVEIIDKGKKSYFTYDGFDVTKQVFDDGKTVEYFYDSWGRIVEEIHKKGGKKSRKQIFYDANGHDSLIVFPEKEQKIFRSYDLEGHLVEERIENFNAKVYQHKKYSYNNQNLLAKSCELIDGFWASNTYEYDILGRCIEQVDPLGNKTSFAYDDFFTNRYGEMVLKVTRIDPDRSRHIQVHDVQNEVVSIETYDPYDNLLRAEYFDRDLNGKVLIQKTLYQSKGDFKEEERHDKYNDTGLLIERHFIFDGKKTRTEKFFYDENENVIEHQKGDRLSIYYDYDATNRLQRFYSSDNTVDYNYVYDETGRLIAVENVVSGSSTLIEYDELGNIESETFENGRSIHFSQDQNGDLEYVYLPDGSFCQYIIRSFGVEEIIRTKKDRTRYHFYINRTDGGGKIKEIDLPRDLGKVEFAYDAKGQCVLKKDFLGSDQIDAFDAACNVTQRFINDALGENRLNYKYDRLNQIVKSNPKGLSRVFSGAGDIDFEGSRAVFVDSKHQIKNLGEDFFEYDIFGNRICKSNEQLETRFSYDALDRIIRVECRDIQIDYSYDFKNRLIKKTVTQNDKQEVYDYVYIDTNEIGCFKDDEENLSQFRLLLDPYTKANPHILYAEVNNSSFIISQDLFQNVTGIYNVDAQALVQAFSYTPFGEIQNAMLVGKFFPWMFAAHRVDEFIGHYIFNKRFYDPKTGQFLSLDPESGASCLNPYQYCKNNPFRYSDADGNYPLDQTFSFDISPWVTKILNRWWEGKEVFKGGLFAGCEVGASLPLDEFTRLLSDPGSYLSQVVRQILVQDRTPVERDNSTKIVILHKKEPKPKINLVSLLEQVKSEKLILVAPDPNFIKQHNAIDIFTNGMRHTKEEAIDAAKALANAIGNSVILVANYSENLLTGTAKAIGSKIFDYQGDVSQILHRIADAALNIEGVNCRVWCHSEGGANAYYAFKVFPEQKKERLVISTFGSAILIPNSFAGRVFNFISEKDFLSLGINVGVLFGITCSSSDCNKLSYNNSLTRDVLELIFKDTEKKYNIIFLPSKKMFFDHQFLGETYQNAIKSLVAP
jgi:RHS repeat-associated protein